MARDENMIAALKRERAAYVAAGNDDRVAQVDEQLERYGYEPEKSEPEGRAQAPQQTADQGRSPAKKTAAKKAPAAEPAAPPASPSTAPTPSAE